MKKCVGVLLMVIMLTGCTLSDSYRIAFDDCMNRTLSYEGQHMGYQKEVFLMGVTKFEYCAQLIEQARRQLRWRGMLLD